MLTGAPLTLIYKKNVFDVMLHLEAERPSKQNFLTAETILAEPGPQQGFKVSGGKINFYGENIFVFVIFLKQFF